MIGGKKIFHKSWMQTALIACTVVSLQIYPLYSGKTVFYGDNYSLLVPGKIFTTNWIKEGVLPFWNPTILAGIPWIGDISQSVLYPSTLVFLVFSPAIALNITVILHLIGTWIAMYMLSHRLTKNRFASMLAASMWTLSHQVMGSINNLATLQSIAWFPMVALAGYRLSSSLRSKCVFAFVITAQLAAGYPQHVIYAVIISFILHLSKDNKNTVSYKKILEIWIKSGILTFLISAWITLPFIQAFLGSTRPLQSTAQATRGSLEAPMLLKAILPYFWDHPTAGYKWGPAWSDQPNVVFYFTWIGLFALIASFRSWSQSSLYKALGITALVLVVLSFGSQLPFYEKVWTNIPILGGGRYPSMALTPAVMLLSILIGHTISLLNSNKLSKRTIVLAALIVISSAFMWVSWQQNGQILWDQISSVVITHSDFHNFARDNILINGILQNLTINSLLFLVSLISLKNKKRYVLIAVIVIDLTYNSRGLLFFGDVTLYDQTNPVSNQLADTIGSDRILTRNSNLPYTDYGTHWEALTTRSPFSDSYVDQQELADQNWLINLQTGYTPDWNMPINIEVINGYTTLVPSDFAANWGNDSETRINYLDTIDHTNQLLDEWAVAYYLVDNRYQVYETIDLPIKRKLENFTLYQRPTALPRIRHADGKPTAITAYTQTPNRLSFDLTIPEATTLRIANRFDNDWHAYVDGVSTPIHNFHGMIQLSIPHSASNVTLRYIPKFFIIGSALSLATLTAIVYLQRIKKSSQYE